MKMMYIRFSCIKLKLASQQLNSEASMQQQFTTMSIGHEWAFKKIRPKELQRTKEAIKNTIPLVMSSLLSGAELLKCSASLYWNLEAPKENPREAKIHGQFIL